MDIDRRAAAIGSLEKSVSNGGSRDGGSRRCAALYPQTVKRPEEEERQETAREEDPASSESVRSLITNTVEMLYVLIHRNVQALVQFGDDSLREKTFKWSFFL